MSIAHDNIDSTSIKKYPSNKYYDYKDSFSDYKQSHNKNDYVIQPHIKKNLYDNSVIQAASQREGSFKMQPKYNLNNAKYKRDPSKQKKKNQKSNTFINASRKMTKSMAESKKCRREKEQNVDEDKNPKPLNKLQQLKNRCLQLRKQNAVLKKKLTKTQESNKIQLKKLQAQANELFLKNKKGQTKFMVKGIISTIDQIKKDVVNKENSQNDQINQQLFDYFNDSIGIINKKYSHTSVTPLEAKKIMKEIMEFLITNKFKIKIKNSIFQQNQ